MFKSVPKEFITLTLILVALFLILTHFTGFSRDANAVFGGWGNLVKTFQGR